MSEPTVPPPPSYTPPPPPTGTPPPPGGTPGAVSPNRTIMIVLSYLGLLALIPFFVEKDDREVQWHAKHGLVLFGVEVVIWVALNILTMMTAPLDLGCGGCMLGGLFGLIVLVVHIVAIIKGVNGDRLIIPGISQYADRF